VKKEKVATLVHIKEGVKELLLGTIELLVFWFFFFFFLSLHILSRSLTLRTKKCAWLPHAVLPLLSTEQFFLLPLTAPY
jgi:hypothetical protein